MLLTDITIICIFHLYIHVHAPYCFVYTYTYTGLSSFELKNE